VDNQLRENSFLGSGWSFPVTFSYGNKQLVTSSYEANINESINTILLTTNGERCFEPQFGSGLQRFYFRQMDETLKGEIKDAVQNALLHNEPRITVTAVAVSYTDIQGGLVQIAITYIYNQTNTRHNYVFPFYLKEGTNIGT
jgi:uncharacterized protein